MRQGPKRQSLNLRIEAEERGLIYRAAKSLGKNRTDFCSAPPAERPKTPCLIAPFSRRAPKPTPSSWPAWTRRRNPLSDCGKPCGLKRAPWE
jgi:hypothetical protein